MLLAEQETARTRAPLPMIASDSRDPYIVHLNTATCKWEVSRYLGVEKATYFNLAGIRTRANIYIYIYIYFGLVGGRQRGPPPPKKCIL